MLGHNKHPITLIEGKTNEDQIQRYIGIVFSGSPLIHRWKDGKIAIEEDQKWITQEIAWTKVDDLTYRSITPSTDNNSETIFLIKILSKSTYYFQIQVNGRTTRDYFISKAEHKKMENKTK